MEIHQQNDTMDDPIHNPFKTSSIPGTPLQQISPERLNQRLPHSPSLPLNFDSSPRRHQPRASDTSDVKARIALLNSISQNGSPTRSTSPTKPYHPASSHAAVQRAVLGREEAEATLNTMTAQLESSKIRERMVAERVESLMEQLSEARNRQRHERHVYEKEVKSSKKSEYKAELAVIKLQEELREVKNESEGIKVRAEHDRAEKEKARQEAFERAYAIAGITEELETLKEKLKAVEMERDSAIAMAATKMALEEKAQLEEMKVSETRPSTRDETLDIREGKTSPGATNPTPQSDHLDDPELDVENCSIERKYAILQKEVKYLKRARAEDQEIIHFMHIQCQFKACPCRQAEADGVRYVHDYVYDRQMQEHNAKKRKVQEDKPLPKPISWAQKRAMRKNKEGVPPNVTSASFDTKPIETNDVQPTSHETIDEEQHLENAIPLACLLPSTEVADQIAEVVLATQIPLPSPSNTPDHTAQLEDITQVIVEPVSSSTQFAFSMSTSSNQHAIDAAPRLYQSQSSVHLSEDLFDLSPPKHSIPRPSTAMGILTVVSPDNTLMDSLNDNHREDDKLAQSQTTRIALNDTSPMKQAREIQRTHSRPNVRSQSRGRSPGPQRLQSLGNDGTETMLNHGPDSPLSSTIFPITPVVKHSRTPLRAQTQPRPERSQIGETQHFYDQHKAMEVTNTTTIPLRDESELILPPAPDSRVHPHAAILVNQELSSSGIKDPHANLPGTPITREAALAQIRARRDRARSVNMRNRSETEHPDGGERQAAGAKTPGSVARRGVKIDLGMRLGLTGGERGRDVSHASAPGRF